MLGVVVWSKESTQAAVVWCEDHGDIAYLKGYDGLAEAPDYLSPDPAPPRWPAVGDLVTLDTAVAGGLRLVRNLSILEADWGPALPASLKGAALGVAGEGAPDPRPAWRPTTPAFPPAPFAPVPPGQGMMKPVPAEPLPASPVALDQGPAVTEMQPRWRRSGLA
ncbi:hypothetical protein [Frigidibacter sp.]|uniref:hypothetical protein n=1 Tax=Frigidibacter sp. TaxID=2586418 RepID=UPI0027374B99|nr:hypothetical protein [Frigidibacter sp.]MDP3340180.1 hypothetical protein [Frigidibacter sp.]